MKQSSKRLTSIFLALVLLVAAFIGFFDFIEPAYGNLQQIRGQLAADEQLLGNLGNAVKQAQSMVAASASQSSTPISLNAVLPSGEDMAGALAQVSGIAVNDNITVNALAFTAPTTQLTSRTATAASATGTLPLSSVLRPVGNFSLHLTANGSYENFKQFLSDLESNVRIFDVQNISIQPVTTSGGISRGRSVPLDYFTYNVIMQTYYQLQ